MVKRMLVLLFKLVYSRFGYVYAPSGKRETALDHKAVELGQAPT